MTLRQTGTNEGDAISGDVDLQIVEVRGGFLARRQRTGGFGGAGLGGPNFGGPGGQRPGPTQRSTAAGQAAVGVIQQIIDANGDGRLSAREIEQAGAALKRLDRNNDGEVSSDELRLPPRSAVNRIDQAP